MSNKFFTGGDNFVKEAKHKGGGSIRRKKAVGGDVTNFTMQPSYSNISVPSGWQNTSQLSAQDRGNAYMTQPGASMFSQLSQGARKGGSIKKRASGGSLSVDDVAGMAKTMQGKRRGGGIKMPKQDNWIQDATKNKGGLHRSLGIPMGEKIPKKRIVKAEHSFNPRIAKQARLAETLSHLRKR